MKKEKRIIISAVLIILGILILPVLSIADESIPPEPIIRSNLTEGKDFSILEIYLKADPDIVWKEVTNPKKGMKIVPVADYENQREFRIQTPLGTKVMICEVKMDAVSKIFSWKRITGDFEEFEGYWRITPSKDYPGYVFVEYANHANPGGIAGKLATENRKRKKLEEAIPNLMALEEK